jgi:L,D-peptidoglycan transpeptidase YkuD (ErfK/YbiS/YcfS/YnhG family)
MRVRSSAPRAAIIGVVAVAGLVGCAAPPAALTSATPTATPTATGIAVATQPRTAPAPRPAGTLLVEQMADTRGASQVITVTTGPGAGPVLEAFDKVGGAWRRAFGPIPAKIGAEGFSGTVSESTTATPIGLFTLTEAFGTGPDPGTALPYRRSRYGDVWVDDPTAPTYNTRQREDADFSKGAGERLWGETRAYEYAVVIDYNRRPVRPGAGSAFFLHVTIPVASQGCVTVDRDHLVRLLRWLDPAARPVIALGPVAAVRRM